MSPGFQRLMCCGFALMVLGCEQLSLPSLNAKPGSVPVVNETGQEQASSRPEIIITPEAFNEIRQIMKRIHVADDEYLRIVLKSGGCTGYLYELGFAEEIEEGHQVIQYQGLNIITPRHLAKVIDGTTISFLELEDRKGFQMTNPKFEGENSDYWIQWLKEHDQK
ncbi:HesB/YadR/YfhF-family protein [Planctopirus limnophila DSM 3776]|uniref:HesB/YadR/YfhF-family protein n=1 Tax=Planctopirus limnophila (strain ATCC 43296 / DSM 3776 / IFAM 1008 / Mu 290) TaxID=521674 RepID=D5STW1_PLAL2|nr:iron-sulfur cluster assembly accessory protein [Planctopirus limnophila]ADG66946.1 HesB/YadR/YfhF-family protein [Planctopirus limnophila DSM 3776]